LEGAINEKKNDCYEKKNATKCDAHTTSTMMRPISIPAFFRHVTHTPNIRARKEVSGSPQFLQLINITSNSPVTNNGPAKR